MGGFTEIFSMGSFLFLATALVDKKATKSQSKRQGTPFLGGRFPESKNHFSAFRSPVFGNRGAD
ncbi:MAG: hypothetical protein ACK41S_08305 [Planctomycetota bacterium]|jgi:hypothetical protein